MKPALIIVDHGSRLAESNRLLEQLAARFHERFAEHYEVVEPAHMELAEPSIAAAYARCAEKGAQRIIVVPYFLGPGKHWTSDIPRLTASAAKQFPHTQYHVAPTLGLDDLILDLLHKRARGCQECNCECDSCRGTLRQGGENGSADVR